MIDRALEPDRLRLWSGAIAAALLFAFVATLWMADGAKLPQGRLGGDLPAFYGAGRILLQGDAPHLYDWSRQAAAQADLAPDPSEGFLAFAYPPFVAVPYAGLALLPYKLAYAVHSLLALGAVVLAVRLLGDLLPRVRRSPLAATVAALTFFPLFRAVTGAQNTPFSALFVTMFGWGAARRDRVGDAVAGAGLGLLAFKPQLLGPLVLLVPATRRPGIGVVAAAIWASLYGIGAAVGGAAWPAWWWDAGVRPFQDHDQAVNAPNSVGWLGFLEAILGVGSPIARAGGLALMLLTLATLLVAWYTPRRDPAALLGLAAASILLFSPHAMFYDAGLLVIPMAVLADRYGRSAVPWLAALWAVALLHPAAKLIGFTPLFLVAAVTGVAAARLALTRR